MPTTFALNRTSQRVELGNGKWLRAPGLTGNAIWRSPTEHKAFLAGASPDQMTRALAEAGLERENGFLSLQGITPSPTQRLVNVLPERSRQHKILVGTTIAPDEVEFAIYRDEDGVISPNRNNLLTISRNDRIPIVSREDPTVAKPTAVSHEIT